MSGIFAIIEETKGGFMIKFITNFILETIISMVLIIWCSNKGWAWIAIALSILLSFVLAFEIINYKQRNNENNKNDN